MFWTSEATLVLIVDWISFTEACGPLQLITPSDIGFNNFSVNSIIILCLPSNDFLAKQRWERQKNLPSENSEAMRRKQNTKKVLNGQSRCSNSQSNSFVVTYSDVEVFLWERLQRRIPSYVRTYCTKTEYSVVGNVRVQRNTCTFM